MEAEIGKGLFKTIRHILIHFPFFESWDEVFVNKSLINWIKEGQYVDQFFERYKGHGAVKYRYWQADKKKMTYLTISFPAEYNDKNSIYLKDIISEKEGVCFSLILMRKIMNTQVEEIKE